MDGFNLWLCPFVLTFCPDLKETHPGEKAESKSFEVVLFSPILDLFWTFNGGRGGNDYVSQVFRQFLPKYWVYI